MGLNELAVADAQEFTTNTDDFGVAVVFNNNQSPPETATVNCLTTVHALKTENEGADVIGSLASLVVSEPALVAAGYTVRNDDGDVDMEDHTATFTNGNGTEKTYVIEEALPDEKLGIIVCGLGEYIET